MLNDKAEILEKLKEMVLQYDGEGAANWARMAVEKGIEPTKAVDAMTAAIRLVGEGFAKGEFWLPDLVGAAAAMQRGARLLEEEMARTGAKRKGLGIVVLGTVFGDIHSIGKDMVGTLLKAEGFTVHDLGINVTAQQFINAIEKEQADILAMSALLTTTAPPSKERLLKP